MKNTTSVIGVLKDQIEVDRHQDQVILNIEISYLSKKQAKVIVKGTLGKALAHRLKTGQMLNVSGSHQGNTILADWIQLI